VVLVAADPAAKHLERTARPFPAARRFLYGARLVSTSPTDRFRRVDAVFDAVLDLPDGEQTAFIDRECGGDEAMRAEVLDLLRAFHRPDGFLDTLAVRLAAPILEEAAALDEAAPERIGPFRVVREIGRGGMGRVFLGERADGQFEQRVALKLIQRGTPGLVRRFIEERRILALLEHPGIARLVDGGLTADGLPYFAMELVDGEPIDRYCDTHALTLDGRIALFTKVCDAVSYAHQHLVIHRDLKPSNILVTPAGQVKLLDFGIAKLLGSDAAGTHVTRTDVTRTDVTRTELRVMTPEFAAPEQVRGTAISTATDVYSLGVLLYRLLAGERPYEIRGKSLVEIERIICEDVPPRPSSRAPVRLQRQLRGDLDLIVMTALQKQEQRRYQSPAALAEDLQRFREGRAILARPDTARYRLVKFVGRHRAAVSVAALLMVGLVGVASRERQLRNRAEVEARKAMEVESFLVRVFDVADPNAWSEPEGGSITARELLDRGASRIDSTLADQPEVQAELRGVLGRVYTNLGLYDKAAPLLQRALAQRTSLRGPQDAAVAENMDLLGAALVQMDKYDEAEPLLRRALDQRRRLLGNTHAATAETIDHLATLFQQRNEYAAAEPLFREALAIRQSLFGDTAVEVGNSLNNLGLILYRRGAYAEAESLYERSLEIKLRRLGEHHALTAATMQNLAQTLQLRGKFAQAETYHRRALAAKRKALGNVHPSVTISLNNLANLLTRQMGRLDEGEALAREALALDRQIFGEKHSYVAASLANLGVILRLKGEFAEAEKALRQSMDVDRALFGELNARVASSLGSIAQTRFYAGDGAAAIALMRQSLAQYRQLLGEAHLSTIVTTGNLGYMLAEYGDPVEAESLSRAVLSRLDSAKSEHRAQILSSELSLGKALLAQGRIDESLPILERVTGMVRKQSGEGHWRTGDALLAYGTALAAKRRYADAEPVLRAARAALEKNRRAQPRPAARAAAAIARLPK
jgi:serine/threonine-protein kinase